ncbi:LysR family transcriptional regulator [Amycolatopsis sp. cmx-11-51]|uniref:LysR family transcriptional regulator n=1 Tax=unclassified Amycolatopsis TaxID=2618356 RepID=UPI0039E216AE
MDIDTRVLRYFAAVAEELNFTRAAERLYVTQPSLSRQIRQLESDLGVTLFTRTSREVLLTAAGETLMPLATALVSDWQAVQRTVRGVAALEGRVLRIGFEASGAGPLTNRARARFAQRLPDVVIEPKRFDWGGEVAAVRDGLVDAAFIWLPADTNGLHTEVVALEQRMVGLAADHRLAKRRSVTIKHLQTEPIMWTSKAPKPWVDWWAVNPRPDGSEPVWGPQNDNVEEMLEQVAGGLAICIGPSSMATYYARPDLVWLPITDIEPLRIAIAYPLSSTNPLVAAFAAAVREMSRSRL